ncbi:MAG: transketolase C-terminal domain-containing protein, partial [Candidatus Manganitrophaceae bacterium]
LRPLDWETVFRSVRKTNKVMIIHEDRRTGGIGGEIAARIAEECFDALDGPIVRVTSEETHYAFSPPLEEFILPNVDKIVAKARTLAAY